MLNASMNSAACSSSLPSVTVFSQDWLITFKFLPEVRIHVTH